MADSLVGWNPESLFGMDENVTSEGKNPFGTPAPTPTPPPETKTEEKPPEAPKVEEQQKPQGKDKIEVSSALLNDAKDLGEFLKKGQNVEDLAIKLASIVDQRVSKQEEMLRNVADNLYFATPEGQEVKAVLDRYAKMGMTREAAMALVKDKSAYQMSLEQRTRTGDQGTGIVLSEKDKRILGILGSSPDQYYKDVAAMQSGKYIHYLDTGGIEVEIDVPMKREERK